jgi:hypothetical protein
MVYLWNLNKILMKSCRFFIRTEIHDILYEEGLKRVQTCVKFMYNVFEKQSFIAVSLISDKFYKRLAMVFQP